MASATIDQLRKSSPILLYDGVCNLCDRSVQFVLKHDTKKKFLFGQLDSKTAQAFLKQQDKDFTAIDSVLLITKDTIYSKSSAALKIMMILGGLWRVTAVFYVLPVPLRDKVYDFIAKRRYAWFGKMATCRIATKEEAIRFID